MLSSRVFGTTRTQSLAVASIASISASGTSRRSLIVSAWQWQRIAPMRTQIESTGIASLPRRPRILLRLGAALPLLAAHAVAEVLVDPRDQAAGERHAEVLGGEALVAQDAGDLAVDVEDRRRRIVEQFARDACASPICCSSSRMFCAPAPDAAW